MHGALPLTAAFLLAVIPASADACSLATSREFTAQPSTERQLMSAHLVIHEVRFVPWMDGDDSCAGLGYLAIEIGLLGRSDRVAREYGYRVRAIDEYDDSIRVPAFVLAPVEWGSGRPFIQWHWGGLAPGADGHVRWRLEVTPVSPSGVYGEPVKVCASTDQTCPEAAAAKS